MAELASAWGWTQQDVDACVWYHVPRHLVSARKDRAKKMQDQLLVVKAQGEAFTNLIKYLERIIDGPRDPRLLEAEQLEAWSRLAPPDKAKSMRERAAYLRTCVKYNLED